MIYCKVRFSVACVHDDNSVLLFVPLLTEDIVEEKTRYKALREEMDVCFQEIQSM